MVFAAVCAELRFVEAVARAAVAAATAVGFVGVNALAAARSAAAFI